MYRRCQLCFLPTLLEVFSASTVEAMYYGLPVVATDFDFNKDVLGDSCLYYEPKNANEAALQLEKLIKNVSLQEECKEKMKIQLMRYNDYDAHFNSIKNFLMNIALFHRGGEVKHRASISYEFAAVVCPRYNDYRRAAA